MTVEGLRELAHLVALIPFVPLAVVSVARRSVDGDHLLFAVALAMSYLGDSLARDGYEHAFLWKPAQFLIAYAATIGEWTEARVLPAIVVCAIALGMYGWNPENGPLLMLVGGSGLVWLARSGTLALPVFVYFGLGSVAFYVWMARLNRPVLDLAAYHFDLLMYQGCRIAAILLFCILIVRPLYARSAHAVRN